MRTMIVYFVLVTAFNSAFAADAVVSITPANLPTSGNGSVKLSVTDSAGKSYQETIGYGPYSTPASIAAGLGAMFARDYLCVAGNCSQGLGALGNGPNGIGTITFRLNSGANFSQITVAPSNTGTSQATPLISWSPPAAIAYGTQLSAQQLDAVSSVPGTFSYSPASGSTLPVGSNTVSVTFTPTDVADYMSVTQATTVTVNSGSASGAASFYQINPFVLVQSNSSSAASIDASTVLNAAPSGPASVSGIVADGTSASILVYRTPSQEDLTLVADSNSGASLFAWDSNFLGGLPSAPPENCPGHELTPGSCLFIPANMLVADPTVAGGYYALALLRAPAPNTVAGITAPITVTANQLTLPGTTSTGFFYPRPVLMIHGLWSDQTAFVNIAQSLLAGAPYYQDITPGASTTGTGSTPIYRVCYSKILPFDSPGAANPQLASCPNGNVDNVPSVDAIRTGLAAIYGALDSEHIVGGRTDVLAHSMGGLAIRSFATTPAYFGNRSLQRGAFYAAISIDSPENGSGLAQYLANPEHADLPYLGNANVSSFEEIVWNAKCNSSDTLATCFVKNSQPISYPGDNLYTGGAVGSLLPGYAAQKNYPFFLPNALNYYISATFVDLFAPNLGGGGLGYLPSPQSILRTSIKAFINDVDTNYPSVSELLGCGFDADSGGPTPECNNDVVVTLPSQQGAFGTPIPSLALQQLAHSGLPTITFNALALFLDATNQSAPGQPTQYLNDNVMNSATVNSMILCALVSLNNCPDVSMQAGNAIISAPSSAPASAPNVALPVNETTAVSAVRGSSQTAQATQTKRKGPNADDRVAIIQPSSPWQLAQPNELSLNISQPGLEKMLISQLTYDDNQQLYAVKEGQSFPSIQHRKNGQSFVTVTPLRLGKTLLSIVGWFPDGGVFKKEIIVYVEPPAVQPKRLVMSAAFSFHGSVPILRMSLDFKGAAMLGPTATYDGLAEAVEIDSHFMKYSLEGQSAPAVIDFDSSTGAIKPLHVGHALVKASYGGLTTSTCISVVGKQDQVQEDRANCSDLIPR